MIQVIALLTAIGLSLGCGWLILMAVRGVRRFRADPRKTPVLQWGFSALVILFFVAFARLTPLGFAPGEPVAQTFVPLMNLSTGRAPKTRPETQPETRPDTSVSLAALAGVQGFDPSPVYSPHNPLAVEERAAPEKTAPDSVPGSVPGLPRDDAYLPVFMYALTGRAEAVEPLPGKYLSLYTGFRPDIPGENPGILIPVRRFIGNKYENLSGLITCGIETTDGTPLKKALDAKMDTSSGEPGTGTPAGIQRSCQGVLDLSLRMDLIDRHCLEQRALEQQELEQNRNPNRNPNNNRARTIAKQTIARCIRRISAPQLRFFIGTETARIELWADGETRLPLKLKTFTPQQDREQEQGRTDTPVPRLTGADSIATRTLIATLLNADQNGIDFSSLLYTESGPERRYAFVRKTDKSPPVPQRRSADKTLDWVRKNMKEIPTVDLFGSTLFTNALPDQDARNRGAWRQVQAFIAPELFYGQTNWALKSPLYKRTYFALDDLHRNAMTAYAANISDSGVTVSRCVTGLALVQVEARWGYKPESISSARKDAAGPYRVLHDRLKYATCATNRAYLSLADGWKRRLEAW